MGSNFLQAPSNKQVSFQETPYCCEAFLQKRFFYLFFLSFLKKCTNRRLSKKPSNCCAPYGVAIISRLQKIKK